MNADNTITRFSFDKDGRYTEVSSSNQVNYVNQWEGIAKGTATLLTEKQTERVKTEMNTLGLHFDPKVARSVKDITSVHSGTMPVIQLREFTSDVPFFLVRFTGKEYPLTVNRTGPTVPKSLLLRSPRYYRDIEEKEKGKQDTDEATAIIKAELSYKNGSQWIPLPTDGPH